MKILLSPEWKAAQVSTGIAARRNPAERNGTESDSILQAPDPNAGPDCC
jgi:hypothetical protein